jgi:hypothetical protein
VNDVAKLFQAVQPGLTLYGVLVTFALISFGFGKYFWEYEKTLVTENVARLKTLLDSYRQRFIEPILARELANGISAAYDDALLGIIEDLYSRKTLDESGKVKREPVPDDQFKSLISEAGLRERLDLLKRGNKKDAFLDSSTGERLYQALDQAYASRHGLWQHYSRASGACGRTAYCFLGLAAVFLTGLLQLLGAWPQALVIVWLIVAGQLLTYGIYSFVRLEWFRRRLLRLWQELQVYGKI